MIHEVSVIQFGTATKQRKSPQLKKRNEYEKTFRTRMENPHAFRKNWPKKKARANRSERAAVRSLMASSHPEDLTGELLKHAVHRHTIRKSGVMPLKDFFGDRLQQRIRMSPELETLDQLLGGNTPLSVIRRLYIDQSAFEAAIVSLLNGGDVRLFSASQKIPRRHWKDTLRSRTGPCTLSITQQGVERVS